MTGPPRVGERLLAEYRIERLPADLGPLGDLRLRDPCGQSFGRELGDLAIQAAPLGGELSLPRIKGLPLRSEVGQSATDLDVVHGLDVKLGYDFCYPGIHSVRTLQECAAGGGRE